MKRDREYELFSIRQDDGKPFFNRNLLRHIKLVSDFDAIVNEVEGHDPLLHISRLVDREAQSVAEAIQEKVKEVLEDFYADAMQHKEVLIVGRSENLAHDDMKIAKVAPTCFSSGIFQEIFFTRSEHQGHG